MWMYEVLSRERMRDTEEAARRRRMVRELTEARRKSRRPLSRLTRARVKPGR